MKLSKLMYVFLLATLLPLSSYAAAQNFTKSISPLTAQSTPNMVVKQLSGTHTVKATIEGECTLIETEFRPISSTALLLLPRAFTTYDNATCVGDPVDIEIIEKEDEEEMFIGLDIKSIAPHKQLGYLTVSVNTFLPSLDVVYKRTPEEQVYEDRLEKIYETQGINKAVLFALSKPKGQNPKDVQPMSLQMSTNGKTFVFAEPDSGETIHATILTK